MTGHSVRVSKSITLYMTGHGMCANGANKMDLIQQISEISKAMKFLLFSILKGFP